MRARFLQAYLLVIDNFAFEFFHHACLRDAFEVAVSEEELEQGMVQKILVPL